MVSLVGVGVISAVLCMLVRQNKPELSPGISIACGVLIMLSVMGMTAPAMELITKLSEQTGLDGGYTRILFKALAICYITQLGSDCCRDVGETAIASKIELAGRAAVAVISVPVFNSLAELIFELLKQ